MHAHLLSLNNFNRPKVFEAGDAAYVHIVYIILLEPGKFQNHPTMGVGLRSRYRHNNDENFLINLQNDIANQIRQFLPELTDVTVTVNHRNNILGIIIDTSTGTYVLSYDGSKDVMNAADNNVLLTEL